MRTLLLVDDYEGVLRSLEFLLRRRGYRTLSATSGRSALELARSEPVAAALVDLYMPGMDGLKTCEALRAQAAASGTEFPIWIMSGAISAESTRRAYELGAIGVLNKPFDCDDVLRELEKLAVSGSASVAGTAAPAA